MDQQDLEALAHRFADELLNFTRNDETKNPEIMARVEALVEGKLEKIVKILLEEGFVMEDPSTWPKWEKDWVVQCKKAREATRSRILLG